MVYTPLAEKSRVVAAVNSGPPSDVILPAIPYVANIRRRQKMRPAAPFEALSTMGQLEYLSTTTR